MSMTPSFGVVGPEYWSYAATCTESYLKNLEAQKNSPPLSPRVELQMQRFFETALAAGSSSHSRAGASIANFQLALEILRESGSPEPAALAEVSEQLESIKARFERATKGEELNTAELSELRGFFAVLARRGREALTSQYRQGEFPQPIRRTA